MWITFFLEIWFWRFCYVKIKYFTEILHLLYLCSLFSILKIVVILLLMKNTRVCVPPCIHDIFEHFHETVTHRTFSKIILSYNFLSYSSFCVNILSKNFLLFAPVFGYGAVKVFNEILKFKGFLIRVWRTVFFCLIAFMFGTNHNNSKSYS